MPESLWTIEQLPDQVAAMLSENYDGQSSGRVRELPNGRTIRWYTTIGLVDRPVAMRGRTALYGPRHVVQLAAVKRLQAAGLTLAEIQGELVGATDERLAELAGAPPPRDTRTPAPARSAEFWKDRPAPPRTAAKNIHSIRLSDTVTVVLDAATRAPNATELAELGTAAAPLLESLERLGLTERKEER
ncbi:hypothetical protein GCM10022247_13740 [Allokutzneria multivorans]|uniref:HTH merR-type domain-containing protein n=1 Tax=Allokutzneria multivorans TaxID=1142134 RepID=A0ABP7RBE0_9PSEU